MNVMFNCCSFQKALTKTAILYWGIHFPQTDDEKQCYASMIEHREPSVRNCIGFVDGIAIPVQCSSKITEQNNDYNGYKHDTNVNNVLAFAPTGKVIYAALNYPG